MNTYICGTMCGVRPRSIQITTMKHPGYATMKHPGDQTGYY